MSCPRLRNDWRCRIPLDWMVTVREAASVFSAYSKRGESIEEKGSVTQPSSEEVCQRRRKRPSLAPLSAASAFISRKLFVQMVLLYFYVVTAKHRSSGGCGYMGAGWVALPLTVSASTTCCILLLLLVVCKGKLNSLSVASIGGCGA